MKHAITLKVCGLTRASDAHLAAEAGASWLGFIFYPKSPRALTFAAYEALRAGLPAATGAAGQPRRVAVMVEPGLAELTAAQRAGFDAFQIHFNPTLPRSQVMEWSELAGPDRLWLAPKLPPGADVSPLLLPLADTFLLDTFHADGFGGSGQTGDWGKFSRHQNAFPQKTWILAGGLNPQNLAAAIARSGARFVDVNSGVEDAPGIKSPALLRALPAALAKPKFVSKI